MRYLAALAAVCLLVACARPATTGTRGGNGNQLTAEQLQGTNSPNMYDALTKLRPEWLQSRGPASVTDASPTVASVYMNGTNLGRIDALRNVMVIEIASARFWDTGSAAARFGQGHPRGVIELTRR